MASSASFQASGLAQRCAPRRRGRHLVCGCGFAVQEDDTFCPKCGNCRGALSLSVTAGMVHNRRALMRVHFDAWVSVRAPAGVASRGAQDGLDSTSRRQRRVRPRSPARRPHRRARTTKEVPVHVDGTAPKANPVHEEGTSPQKEKAMSEEYQLAETPTLPTLCGSRSPASTLPSLDSARLSQAETQSGLRDGQVDEACTLPTLLTWRSTGGPRHTAKHPAPNERDVTQSKISHEAKGSLTEALPENPGSQPKTSHEASGSLAAEPPKSPGRASKTSNEATSTVVEAHQQRYFSHTARAASALPTPVWACPQHLSPTLATDSVSKVKAHAADVRVGEVSESDSESESESDSGSDADDDDDMANCGLSISPETLAVWSAVGLWLHETSIEAATLSHEVAVHAAARSHELAVQAHPHVEAAVVSASSAAGRATRSAAVGGAWALSHLLRRARDGLHRYIQSREDRRRRSLPASVSEAKKDDHLQVEARSSAPADRGAPEQADTAAAETRDDLSAAGRHPAGMDGGFPAWGWHTPHPASFHHMGHGVPMALPPRGDFHRDPYAPSMHPFAHWWQDPGGMWLHHAAMGGPMAYHGLPLRYGGATPHPDAAAAPSHVHEGPSRSPATP